jgi:hypothetical protein
MTRIRTMSVAVKLGLGLLVSALSSVQAAGLTLDDLRVQREEVFEFTKKPTVTVDGDNVTITFAVKGYCDATIAIENAEGRILRYLASGVLGKNAPPPFQKDSLRQTVVWDGKDELGRYIDDRANVAIRVSLGLKPRFERSLLWSAKRRVSRVPPSIAPAPEGVYVFGGHTFDHLRLFDHDGNYVRTTFPFPSDKIAQARGVFWKTFPQDGKKLPIKANFYQTAMLTSGDNMHGGVDFDPEKGIYRNSIGLTYHRLMSGTAGTMLAVRDGRIALGHLSLNRLSTDGATARAFDGGGRLPLSGPGILQTEGFYTIHGFRGGSRNLPPRRAAFSPDGRTLYLSGYLYDLGWHVGGLHVVMRMPFDGDQKPSVFAGSTGLASVGKKNGEFGIATSVDCDAQGRVYVADYLNRRIQVFDPQGKHLANVPTPAPMHVQVCPKTGEIWVASWAFWHGNGGMNRHLLRGAQKAGLGFPQQRDVPPALIRYGRLDNPKKLASWPLPFHRYNVWHGSIGINEYQVTVDFHTDPPTVWQIPWGAGGAGGSRGIPPEQRSIRLLRPKDDKLVLIRDFGADTRKVMPTQELRARSRLYVNPKNGTLYVASMTQPDPGTGASKAFPQWIKVNPKSGRSQVANLPMDAEDAAFDLEGRVYLRGMQAVGRFDAETWREIPWDYGENRRSGFMNKKPELASSLPTTGGINWHMGGIAVSPRGRLAVTSYVDAKHVKTGRGERDLFDNVSGTGYTPRIFPGRRVGGKYPVIHVWDRHGKLVHEDAVPGLSITHGIGIDRDDALYIMETAQPFIDGKPWFNRGAGTLVKFRPGKGRILSPGGVIPLPKSQHPDRPKDLNTGWLENAEWMFGGVGVFTKRGIGCDCINCSFALDYFRRSFAPEIDRYSVAVVDGNGNLILRIGQYGNADDGVPLIKRGGPPNPRSIGGDEVALFHGAYLATQTDRRLFICDVGNGRVVSVKLGYHTTERVGLAAAQSGKTE